MPMNESSHLLDRDLSSGSRRKRAILEETMETVNSMSPLAKSVILGGIDGVLSSVGLICGCVGGDVHWSSLLIAGFTIIVANAVNIGISEYLSSKAHRSFVLAEERRLLWTYKHNPEMRIRIMVDVFESKGMTKSDAEVVVKKMSQYESFFVSTMLTEELGLTHPDDDDSVLLLDSFVMFISFAGFGFVPLLPYWLIPLELLEADKVFAYSLGVSGALLFFLGGLKSTFKSNFGTIAWSYSSFEVLFMGAIIGILAYVVGQQLGSALGSNHTL